MVIRNIILIIQYLQIYFQDFFILRLGVICGASSCGVSSGVGDSSVFVGHIFDSGIFIFGTIPPPTLGAGVVFCSTGAVGATVGVGVCSTGGGAVGVGVCGDACQGLRPALFTICAICENLSCADCFDNPVTFPRNLATE